jgi:tetratricopeptide (TPR) repeat protein
VPERQQTLRNAIDWSYDLLTASEQLLFRRLGVFVGGCTLNAAEAVCNADGDLALGLLDSIAALIDHSLLRQEVGADGEPRFVMLETIHEYALERLVASGEAETLRQRHLAYYLTFAELADPRLYQSDQLVWMKRLTQEHDNLRAALASSQATEAELRLVAALGHFWEACGYPHEGRERLVGALARADPSRQTEVRATALNQAGYVCVSLGDEVAGRAFYKECLALSRSIGSKRNVGYALAGLGRIAAHQSDFVEAASLLEESLRLFRESGEKIGIAYTLGKLGRIAHQRGDDLRARQCLSESLQLYQEMGDLWGSAWALIRQAEFERSDGYRARALLVESLAQFQQIGDMRGTADVVAHLAELARSQNDDQQAAALYKESLGFYQKLGANRAIAWIVYYLGSIAHHQGDHVQAAERFRASLQHFLELPDKLGIAYGLAGLASLAGPDGQPERAARLLGAAETLLDATGAHLPSAERAGHERNVLAVRAQLGEAAFVAAWDAGRAMTTEQAITYALTEGGSWPS